MLEDICHDRHAAVYCQEEEVIHKYLLRIAGEDAEEHHQVGEWCEGGDDILEYQHIGQSPESVTLVFAAEEGGTMLPEGLHHTEAPTGTLLHKLMNALRGFCHRHSIVLILDGVTLHDDVHREVAVFCQRIGGESSCTDDGTLAEGSDGTRHYGDGINVGIGHTVEVLTCGVLDGLPAG